MKILGVYIALLSIISIYFFDGIDISLDISLENCTDGQGSCLLVLDWDWMGELLVWDWVGG